MNMQIDLDGENMKVTKEDLENVAVLSRLSVPEGKAETYIQQMDSILTYMDNLSKVDTENVKPTRADGAGRHGLQVVLPG